MRKIFLAALTSLALYPQTASAEGFLSRSVDDLLKSACQPQPPLTIPSREDVDPVQTPEYIHVEGIRIVENIPDFELPFQPFMNCFPNPGQFSLAAQSGVRLSIIQALSNNKPGIEDLLHSLENVRSLISADYACFRKATGSPRLTMFSRSALRPFRQAALVAYAEAKIVHGDEALAERARQSWFGFNAMMAADPDGIFDMKASADDALTDPFWNEAQQFLEAVGDYFSSNGAEAEYLLTKAFTDRAVDPWSYSLEELLLTDLLCGETSHTSLAALGLSCRSIKSEDHAPYMEIFNPALPSDYHGPDSYELSPVISNRIEVERVYLSARQEELKNWQTRLEENLYTHCRGLPSIGPCQGQD